MNDQKNIKNTLIELFEKTFSEKALQFNALPAHGSNRQYFRISGKTQICLGAFNEDTTENRAFIYLTHHFRANGLPVPQLYAEDNTKRFYLIEDLGDQTLYDYLTREKSRNDITENVINIYKKALYFLPKFQITASAGLDFSICYPRAAFDKQSMMWDLNYFKYYFLKFKNIIFNEQDLEDDFHKFGDFLLSAPREYFLYRDFQSRNIMVKDGKVYFIDYQGGRRGALFYDPASLLYDAKANLSPQMRAQLLDYYRGQLRLYIPVNDDEFSRYYEGYALLRIMQAFGAYGFRGYYEKKEHFIKSVPYAAKNLKSLLNSLNLPVKIPVLLKALEQVANITV